MTGKGAPAMGRRLAGFARPRPAGDFLQREASHESR